jgi:hypothetical protein
VLYSSIKQHLSDKSINNVNVVARRTRRWFDVAVSIAEHAIALIDATKYWFEDECRMDVAR